MQGFKVSSKHSNVIFLILIYEKNIIFFLLCLLYNKFLPNERYKKYPKCCQHIKIKLKSTISLSTTVQVTSTSEHFYFQLCQLVIFFLWFFNFRKIPFAFFKWYCQKKKKINSGIMHLNEHKITYILPFVFCIDFVLLLVY